MHNWKRRTVLHRWLKTLRAEIDRSILRLIVRASSACIISSLGFISIPPLHVTIAGASGGTNAMDVSKNVQAWKCTLCPARPRACCPGQRQLLLDAWVSSDARQVSLRKPYERHPPPHPRGPLVSVWFRSGHIRKLLPQLCVCGLFRARDCIHISPAHFTDSDS